MTISRTSFLRDRHPAWALVFNPESKKWPCERLIALIEKRKDALFTKHLMELKKPKPMGGKYSVVREDRFKTEGEK